MKKYWLVLENLCNIPVISEPDQELSLSKKQLERQKKGGLAFTVFLYFIENEVGNLVGDKHKTMGKLEVKKIGGLYKAQKNIAKRHSAEGKRRSMEVG